MHGKGADRKMWHKFGYAENRRFYRDSSVLSRVTSREIQKMLTEGRQSLLVALGSSFARSMLPRVENLVKSERLKAERESTHCFLCPILFLNKKFDHFTSVTVDLLTC